MGGRGAGRSTVASQFANAKLVSPEYFRCAIMRYVLGDIRNSIYREITDRAEENGILGSLDVNDSMMTLEYGANSINAVGFKKSSGDQKAKLKSLANYTTVIIEEADEIPEEDFIQLDDSLRTLKGDITIILLLNPPPKSHWIVNRWFNLLPSGVKDFYIPELKSEMHDTTFIRTSYKDNEKNLAPQSIENYQRYKETKPDHYHNMVLGYVPETVRGKIYSGWREIEGVPFEARLIRRGLDFGYSNDPTALIDIYEYNGGYILDEQLYRKGMLNKQIADFTNNLHHNDCIVVADSAEPKSIDEIKLYGVTILPAVKGKGSIATGINFVRGQRISYTKRSVNLKVEYENYAWLEDKDGNVLNEPKPGYDHCFTGETLVYTTKGKKQIKDLVGKEGYVFSRAGKIEKFYNVRQTRTNTEVVKLTFDDGNVLSVTPDHLLLQPNGEWIEAGLLVPKDMIQSAMYESNLHIQQLQVYKIQKRKILQRASEWCIKMVTSLYMGNRSWTDTKGFPYTSQRPQYFKQFLSKLGIKTQKSAFERTYESPETKKTTIVGRSYTSSYKEVAWLKRGNRVAQITWTENVGEKEIHRKSMFTLPQEVSNEGLEEFGKILWTELQNESKTKTVIRIERGFSAVTYNMEVQGTHCLIANGVVAHNCMDALRYGLGSVLSPNEFISEAKVSYTL